MTRLLDTLSPTAAAAIPYQPSQGRPPHNHEAYKKKEGILGQTGGGAAVRSVGESVVAQGRSQPCCCFALLCSALLPHSLTPCLPACLHACLTLVTYLD